MIYKTTVFVQMFLVFMNEGRHVQASFPVSDQIIYVKCTFAKDAEQLSRPQNVVNICKIL